MAETIHAGLYTSNYQPRGVKKDWERSSMDVKNVREAFAGPLQLVRGEITEAVAWFTEAGAVRLLVVDTDAIRRATLRMDTRGGWKLTTEARL